MVSIYEFYSCGIPLADWQERCGELPQMIYDMQNFGILFALIETRALALFSAYCISGLSRPDDTYYMRANGRPFRAMSGCKWTQQSKPIIISCQIKKSAGLPRWETSGSFQQR